MNSRSLFHPVFLGLWLLGAAASYFLLLQYKGTPGGAGTPPGLWPRQSLVSLDPTRLTLVMLAHPLCPCTASSIEELERFLGHFPGRVSAHVLFLDPDVALSGWQGNDLRSRGAAIPGLTVSSGPMGHEAKKFGAVTSGHVLLYGQDGRLLFSGGITPARGHGGASRGLQGLEAVLQGPDGTVSDAPVFGCPLEGPCLTAIKEKY